MKIGCIVLAGGLGTRLKHIGPKGTFVYQGKPLFRHIVKGDGPFAVMTSEVTDRETRRVFEGDEVDVFVQESLPVIDGDGKYPDGNGKCLHYFFRSGVFAKWRKMGIDVVSVVAVDNPLCQPFDYPEFSGDLAVKVVKALPDESLGRVHMNEAFRIVEYSESEVETELGYTGMFACKMDWIEKIQSVTLEPHIVEKKGRHHTEYFVFDLFAHAKNTQVIEVERAKSFHPIKSRSDI